MLPVDVHRSRCVVILMLFFKINTLMRVFIVEAVMAAPRRVPVEGMVVVEVLVVETRRMLS